MKWWQLLVGLIVLGAVAVLLAGKADIIRIRQMHQM